MVFGGSCSIRQTKISSTVLQPNPDGQFKFPQAGRLNYQSFAVTELVSDLGNFSQVFGVFYRRLCGKRKRVRPKANAGEPWATVAPVRSTGCPQARPVGRTVVHGASADPEWSYSSCCRPGTIRALPQIQRLSWVHKPILNDQPERRLWVQRSWIGFASQGQTAFSYTDCSRQFWRFGFDNLDLSHPRSAMTSMLTTGMTS